MNMKNMSFQSKILGIVGLTCVICGSISVGVAVHFNNVEFHQGLLEKSRTIHGRLDVVAKYVAGQGGLKTIVDQYTKLYQDSRELTDKDKNLILQQVPIYAAMRVGDEGAEKENYRFRVFSNEPRNKDNQATPEELEIFEKFEKDPTLRELTKDTSEYVTVYRPVRISESHGCLTCHGAPQTSPWRNGKDILGYPMEDWKDGKLHGVFAVINPVKEVAAAKAATEGTSSTILLSIFITIGGIIALLIAAWFTRGPIRSLRLITDSLSKTGSEVSHASVNIASSSQDLSQASTEQAASLEETAAALEQMSAMVAKNTENARNTASSSEESRIKAEEGKNAVERMMMSMEEINQSNGEILSQVQHNNDQMMEIATLIREIGNKTKVINEIVFQTKLLSFNASVEAARAGEHGKGFAVVAGEVGNLAQMSGNAAKEISEMLDGSILRVEGIVNETKSKIEDLVHQSKSKVESGFEVTQQCAVILNEIVSNVGSVASMAGEISSASQEQSHGLREINQAMQQLNQVTQQNAATSEAAASASRQLSTQATALKDAVSDLAQTIEGGAFQEDSSTAHLTQSNMAPSHSTAAKIVRLDSKKSPQKKAKKLPEYVSDVTSSSEQRPQAVASGDSVAIPSRDHSGFQE